VAVMTQARQRSIPIRAVTVATRIEDLPVAEDVKAVMRNAFGADVAYVVPSASVTVNGAERLGWWRLDLRTGETLAVLDNGLHFTVGELLLSVAIITAIAAAAVPLYYALIDYVNASIEQWPGCMGLAHWCRVYGPPPPGCTYDPVEGYISCE